jgi:CBS domain-containing membrane protein
MAIILNRWLLGNSYPILTQADTNKEKSKISDHDLKHALKNMDTFMDVSLEDLSKLLATVEKNNFQRFKGNICCADIMVKNPPSVEYGTEVETAWQIMLNDKLKAMPVIDKSRRVIGITRCSSF